VSPRLLFEAARRAEAMGLVEPGAVAKGDVNAVRHLASRVRRAGIAAAAADELNNVAAPTSAEVAGLLETMVAALEASPVPKFEWGGLARVFPPDDLAALLNISVSSLKRYEHGDRETPDATAARLHFLALVVGDLAGSYNDIGIRRWFHRKRTLLDGRAPASILAGDWDPDDDGPASVRALARTLTTLSAT
jgi:transcriptional regulator with XRE-family HTH domain